MASIDEVVTALEAIKSSLDGTSGQLTAAGSDAAEVHSLLATLGVEENAGHMELCKSKIDETIEQLSGTLSAIDEALQQALAAKGAT